MIGYVTLGTNSFEQAVHFYDELLALTGARRAMETARKSIYRGDCFVA